MRRRYIMASIFFAAAFALAGMCYGSYRYAEDMEADRRPDAQADEGGERLASADEQESAPPSESEQPDLTAAFAGKNGGGMDEDGFFLTVEKGEVVVYDKNHKVLRERTGISIKHLPADEVKKLKKGFVAENEKDLYSILENFSS